MSRFSVNIVNLPAVQKAVRERLNASLLPRIERRVREAVAERIKDILVDSLRETRHYKGIRGDYAGDKQWDIQAHMGLYSETAEQFLYEIEKTVRDSIKVSVSNQGIGIRISAPNINDKLLATQGSEYISEPSGVVIPWLRWLIEGQGEVDAWIDFNIEHFNIESSRSERAIMHTNNNFPNWRVDSYSFGKQDKMLMDEVINNPAVLKKLEQIIRSEYINQIKIINQRGR